MQTTRSRPYVTDDTQGRIEKYSRDKNIPNIEAYHEIITAALDENGKPRNALSLTEAQRNAIDQISNDMDQSPSKTTQELINFALLIFSTNIPLNAALMRTVPLMMDELVQAKPGIAKEILMSLKQEIRTDTSKPAPQAVPGLLASATSAVKGI